jgi:glycosyltransferase involved in cell wall biosynthesis
MPSNPMVSVVVCTRGRGAPLRRTLESLCGQTLPRGSLEVVLVDDGSAGDVGDLLRELAPRLAIRASRQRPAGIASARNHGLFLARGVVVFFLDEDVAAPDLLERHLEAHRRNPEPRLAVVGATALDPAVAEDPLMRFLARLGGSAWASPSAASGARLAWSSFRAGRASCKRDFLIYRGIFDATFHAAGEDVELAYRLSRHGFEAVHEPAAVVRLAERRTVEDVCARARLEGESSARLARLHPGPEVEAFAGVAAAAEVWRELGPEHDAIVRSAVELDRLARARADAALPFDAREVALLDRAYLAALEASRARGATEARSALLPARLPPC